LTKITIIGLCTALLACGTAVASEDGETAMIGLIPFGYSDDNTRWISNKLFEALEEEIEASTEYGLIRNRDLEDAFEDIGFDPGQFRYGVPPDFIADAGVIMGADLIVFGFVVPGGNEYQVLWNVAMITSANVVSPPPTYVTKNTGPVGALAGEIIQSLGAVVGQRAQEALNMAQYHMSVKNWSMAISSYRQALAVDPSLTDALLELASVYLRSEVDSTARAREIYEEILAEDSDNSVALGGMGSVLLSEGNPEEAKDYFDSAIEVDPDNASAYLGLAAAYNELGMLDEAVTSFENALVQNPGNLQARYALGLLYIQLENYDEAIPHLETILDVRPEFSNLRLKLIAAYVEQGRYSDAADNAVILLEDQSDNVDLILYTAQMEARAGRTTSSVNRLEALISSTGNRQGYILLATVYRDSGQRGAMQNVFSRLKSAYPNDPIANYMMGAFYYSSGTQKAQVSELIIENVPTWETAVSELNTAISYLNQVTGSMSGQAQNMIVAAQNAIGLCEEKIDRVERYSQ
jgi:tetratricopeptide (TPR) repeat protein